MALLQKNIARMDEFLQLVRAKGDPRQRIQVAATASVNFLLESAALLDVYFQGIDAR